MRLKTWMFGPFQKLDSFHLSKFLSGALSWDKLDYKRSFKVRHLISVSQSSSFCSHILSFAFLSPPSLCYLAMAKWFDTSIALCNIVRFWSCKDLHEISLTGVSVSVKQICMVTGWGLDHTQSRKLERKTFGHRKSADTNSFPLSSQIFLTLLKFLETLLICMSFYLTLTA